MIEQEHIKKRKFYSYSPLTLKNNQQYFLKDYPTILLIKEVLITNEKYKTFGKYYINNLLNEIKYRLDNNIKR